MLGLNHLTIPIATFVVSFPSRLDRRDGCRFAAIPSSLSRTVWPLLSVASIAAAATSLPGSVLLSGRFRLRLVSHRGRLADTTEFAESGAQSFPLRRKPVSFSMRFLVPTFGPEVTGTFADRFSISCISFSVQGPLPQREIASGSPDVLFRPFESKSMTLDG